MNKLRKQLKQVISCALVCLVAVLSVSPLVATATDNYSYKLDIQRDGKYSHTSYMLYRNTNVKTNKWGVKLTHSNEPTKGHHDGSENTATRFWLGVNNPNGTNPEGSKKVNVKEGALTYTKTDAYANASLKNVYLYASDNSSTNVQYNVEGYWYAYTA